MNGKPYTFNSAQEDWLRDLETTDAPQGTGEWSFKQIAVYIRANPRNVFIDEEELADAS